MQIQIKQLHAPAIIGVHDFEKHAPQDLFIDIALDVDVKEALDSDDLADTVDYDALCKKITSFVADSRFDLLEALANTLIKKIFQFSSKIKAIDLCIHKPGAISNASTVIFALQSSR